MTEKIRRFKNEDEMTVDDHVKAMAAAKRGEQMRFERQEYTDARAACLRDAGLEGDDDDTLPANVEDWTPAQHAENMRRGR